MYNKKLLEMFDRVDNYGLLRGYNASSQMTCDISGDIVKIYLIIDNDKIVDAKFKAFGSMETIVCASACAKFVIGKTISEAENFTPSMIAEDLAEVVSNTYSIKLCFDAIKLTIEEYREKLAKQAKKQAKK